MMADDPNDCKSSLLAIIAEINVSSGIFPDITENHNIENILRGIAETGFVELDWKTCIMPVIALKMNEQFSLYLSKFGYHSPTLETFDIRRAEIFDMLQSFENPPFTVQRLVELIRNPSVSYKSTNKFMNGVLKLLSVTS